MNARIPRREALRHLAVVSLSAVLPAGLAACSKKTTCTDLTGLSADEVHQRTNVAAYVDQTPDATRACALCLHFVQAAPNACGTCKVVKGPIHPDGTCKLFAPRPT